MQLRPVLFLVFILGLAASSLATEKDIPELPAEGSSGAAKKLKVGEKIALDELGPTIVNEDGTIRRITNWSDLTEAEQAKVLQRLKHRNLERLQKLRSTYEGVDEKIEEVNTSREKLSKEDHLKKYMEALKALNKVSGENPVEQAFMSTADTDGTDKDGKPKLDISKLQETLEMLREQQEAMPSRTEL